MGWQDINLTNKKIKRFLSKGACKAMRLVANQRKNYGNKENIKLYDHDWVS